MKEDKNEVAIIHDEESLLMPKPHDETHTKRGQKVSRTVSPSLMLHVELQREESAERLFGGSVYEACGQRRRDWVGCEGKSRSIISTSSTSCKHNNEPSLQKVVFI